MKILQPSSAEMRIRELDSQIMKAKNKLEALKMRKRILYSRLKTLQEACYRNNRRNMGVTQSDEDISQMLGRMHSMTLVSEIPPEERPSDDVQMKFSVMTLGETLIVREYTIEESPASPDPSDSESQD